MKVCTFDFLKKKKKKKEKVINLILKKKKKKKKKKQNLKKTNKEWFVQTIKIVNELTEIELFWFWNSECLCSD